MTKAEFVEANRHEIAGLVLDAATANRSGADLALWLRTVMRRIDAVLSAAYDKIAPEPPAAPATPPQANGQARPHQPQRK